ncbi:hypothetical protein, partial [Acinetobacter nosocomialis]
MWNPNSIIFCFYFIFSILALWGIVEA